MMDTQATATAPPPAAALLAASDAAALLQDMCRFPEVLELYKQCVTKELASRVEQRLGAFKRYLPSAAAAGVAPGLVPNE